MPELFDQKGIVHDLDPANDCPNCQGTLVFAEDGAVCDNCGQEYTETKPNETDKL